MWAGEYQSRSPSLSQYEAEKVPVYQPLRLINQGKETLPCGVYSSFFSDYAPTTILRIPGSFGIVAQVRHLPADPSCLSCSPASWLDCFASLDTCSPSARPHLHVKAWKLRGIRTGLPHKSWRVVNSQCHGTLTGAPLHPPPPPSRGSSMPSETECQAGVKTARSISRGYTLSLLLNRS